MLSSRQNAQLVMKKIVRILVLAFGIQQPAEIFLRHFQLNRVFIMFHVIKIKCSLSKEPTSVSMMVNAMQMEICAIKFLIPCAFAKTANAKYLVSSIINVFHF